MQILFVLFTIAAGVASALQSGANNTLQKSLNTPLWRIVIVAATTLVGSLAVIPFAGRLPGGAAVSSVPWYGWIGGLLGIAYILVTVFASPKLGRGSSWR